jgi:hypothetical protein
VRTRGWPVAIIVGLGVVVGLVGGTARARDDGAGGAPEVRMSSSSAVSTPSRPPPPPARDAAPLVKTVYERGFPFCRDPSYPMTAEEIAWCDLLPRGPKGSETKPDARCPGLAALCTKGPTAELMGRQRLRRSFSVQGPVIPSAVVWILLAVGVAIVLYRLLGQSLALGPATDEKRPAPATGDDAAAREAARQVETDVERLLARARAAAAAGDFERGVADAYAALLRKLEGAGLVRVEAGRTNGDHLRGVARKLPEAEAEMRPLVRVVERAQFGGVAADESSFRFVLDGVVRLLAGRLAAFLPVVFALGLVGALVGLAACGLDREGWDDSPSGQAGVLDLLKKYGFEAHERLAPLAKLAPGGGAVDIVVLMPEIDVGKDDWSKLDAWVEGGGTLLVAGAFRELPAWLPVKVSSKVSTAHLSAPLTVPARLAPWFTGKTALVPPGPSLQITRTAEPPVASGAREASGAERQGDDGDDGDGDGDDGDDDDDDADDAAATPAKGDDAEEEPPPGLWPLLERAGHPYAVEGFHGEGRVVVLADERLFTNAALLVPDDAALLTDLLRRDGQRLEVADDLTGLVSPNPLASVSRGRLAPALAQLALLVVLFFFYRGAHFGRPRDPVLSRRRAFAEHARAVGVQYARGRAARHALWLYGGYALERLRERLHLAGGKSLSSVAEAVAARTGRPLGEVMRVLVEARPDAEPPAPVKPGTMLSAGARAEAAAPDLARLRDVATLLSQTGGAGERSRVSGQG